jgi:hypothetical protein
MDESLEICALRKELARAEADSARLCKQRAAMPPGSSRARVTTLNAKWARVAEYRDLIRARLEDLEDLDADADIDTNTDTDID